MNKSKLSLLLTAMMFAAVFTLSCSSGGDGDGDGSTSSISDLPTQLYIKEVINYGSCPENGECTGTIYGDTYEYNGGGDITFSLYDNEENKNTFSVGEIKNGKIIWELPEIPNSEKYLNDGEIIIEEPRRFVANIPDKGSCALYLQNSDEGYVGMLVYSLKAQKITEGEDDELVEVNLSKGWNVIYIDASTNLTIISTDSKIVKGKLQWNALCDVGTN